MWLKLDLEGMKLELQIKGYQPSNIENRNDQWCKVDFSFRFQECINYSRQDDEVFLSCEIETLESKLDDFIEDKIKEKETLDFLEPDFEFVFFPNYNKGESGASTYAAPEHEMSVAIVEWKVNLWCHGLTDNYFSNSLVKEECIVFRDYLRLVMGKLNKNSIVIQEYAKAGFIGGQF